MNVRAGDTSMPSIGDYFSATKLRADRWSALREAAESLLRHNYNQKMAKKLLHTTQELVHSLAPIEDYWAFPGQQTVEEGVHGRRVYRIAPRPRNSTPIRAAIR